MNDPRIEKLAEVLVGHSLELAAGERVMIECFDLPDPALPTALVRKVAQRGALPLVVVRSNRVLRELYRQATPELMRWLGELERARMEQVQAYVGIRGTENASEFSDVPHEKMELHQRYIWRPVHLEVRVAKTKWVVLRYPNPAMAQAANMSTEGFEEFYFRVCTVDYAVMAKAQEPLVQLMKQTDRVRIVGPGTDLEFSIKGVPVVPCHGKRNIPDGEVFTAPVRDSVNGRIRFNTPALYQGIRFEAIELQFKDGRIVEGSCSTDHARLNKILDSDDGARYCGEWALGCNPEIREPMLDTLFDEKIAGSMHLTPGNAYPEADNGNRSEIHWDLVLIQRPEYGGGEIYFDGQLVRKDGLFVLPELQALTPPGN